MDYMDSHIVITLANNADGEAILIHMQEESVARM